MAMRKARAVCSKLSSGSPMPITTMWLSRRAPVGVGHSPKASRATIS